ncbi:hypothetical protein OG206_01145 [Streptomyces sp. NBC_01341]|uniref:hypothetical protein n=1 Tax=Streptomyces sp. NBC_01341 TaxID=2903831 RepID=UPI002E11C3EE|nr:hypothetical protein OG206_01145 [Streptomyces sp. NBC_01341]
MATGAAGVAMLHAAVLGVSSRGEPYPDLAWVDSAEAMTSVYVLVPWPLTALVLLWLASRRPALYVRTALALLLTSGIELAYACWVPLTHLPAHEGSLFREYVALPGALTGWYLLTALAMATAVLSHRVRAAVITAGLGIVVISTLTSTDPALAGLFAAGTPLLAWFVAGRVPAQRARWPRPAGSRDPQGGTVSFRTRAPARGPARTPQAG